MLRIIQRPVGDSTVLLKLEGTLLKPWIEELRRTIEDCDTRRNALHLDLSDLSFADAAGTQALVELLRDGARLAACSAYIAALLGDRESSSAKS